MRVIYRYQQGRFRGDGIYEVYNRVLEFGARYLRCNGI
jgi:hypothetical protein